MDKEFIIKLLFEAKRLGIKNFMLSGFGEPFMRKDMVFEIVKTVKEYGISGGLVTNGTLLERKEVEYLISKGWDNVIVSVESYLPSVHDSIVGVKGAFERTIKTLSLFSKLKKKMKKEKPSVSLNVVVGKWNFNTLKGFLLLSKKFDCELIFQSLMLVKNLRTKKENFPLLKKEVKKSIEMAKKLKVKTNLDVFLDTKYIVYADNLWEIVKNSVNKSGFPYVPCYLPWYGMTITHEGGVGPCPKLAEEGKINVFSRSLKKIWFEDFEKFRKNVFRYAKNCSICTPLIVKNQKILKRIKSLKL